MDCDSVLHFLRNVLYLEPKQAHNSDFIILGKRELWKKITLMREMNLNQCLCVSAESEGSHCLS